jgi:hypothetical protein
LQCEYHPNRIAVGRCHKCGNRFCVECAEETGQTRLCQRCLAEASPARKKAAQAPASPPSAQAPVPVQVEDTGGKKGEEEAFLAQGPDYDFSDLQREVRRTSSSRPESAQPARAAVPEDAPETPPPAGLDLDDVLASLAGTSTAAPAAARPRGENAAEDTGDIALAKTQKERLREIREQKQQEKREKRQERVDRWDFLSQPRQADTTYIALSKPRAVLFVLAMWLLAAFLWAAPNAYLVPQDSEWVIHAILVGVVISICFWWKAGKKHSTKLAVQAMLVTIFGLLAGEFLHAFLIVMKQPAFRTIFMDVLSFKFVMDNGGTLLSAIVEDMFPISYLWILVPPAVVAFLIGYGMPPIPEIFFEFGRALRGKPKAGKEHA